MKSSKQPVSSLSLVEKKQEGIESGWFWGQGLLSELGTEKLIELSAGKIPWTDESVAASFDPMLEMTEAGFYPSERFSTAFFTEACPELWRRKRRDDHRHVEHRLLLGRIQQDSR